MLVTNITSAHLLYWTTLCQPVCDDTQNLNQTESETFLRYQIFPIPNPKLFSIHNFFDTEPDTFFDTKFCDTESEILLKNGKVSKPRSFENKFFRYRIRYFFRYQIFMILNPILFSIPNPKPSEKNKKVSKPKRHTLMPTRYKSRYQDFHNFCCAILFSYIIIPQVKQILESRICGLLFDCLVGPLSVWWQQCNQSYRSDHFTTWISSYS